MVVLVGCGLWIAAVGAQEEVRPALAPSGVRIGVVDMERAFMGHPGREAAEARAEKAQAEARKGFVEKSNELKKLLQEHQEVTRSIVAGTGDLEAKKKEAEELLKAAEAKEIEVATMRTTQARDLEVLFLEERGKLMDEVRAAVRAHNEELGLELVLDTSAVRPNGIPLVVDVRGLPDLTDAVVARLKAAPKAEGE